MEQCSIIPEILLCFSYPTSWLRKNGEGAGPCRFVYAFLFSLTYPLDALPYVTHQPGQVRAKIYFLRVLHMPHFCFGNSQSELISMKAIMCGLARVSITSSG